MFASPLVWEIVVGVGFDVRKKSYTGADFPLATISPQQGKLALPAIVGQACELIVSGFFLPDYRAPNTLPL
jgi:hypothetical protein